MSNLAVIFDLGNVLVDYDHAQTMQALADRSAVDSEHMAAFFRTLSEDAGCGHLDAEELHAALVNATELSATFEEFIELFAAGITRDEEALAYAVSLQQRPDLTVAVISNTNAAHVHWLDERIPELAEFDLVMMSNEVGMLKPDPTIFRLALELLDQPPERALFIDDIAANVAGATDLGLTGIVHHAWSETRPQIEAWIAAGSGERQ